MSELYQSLSHSKWDCKYHVVFVPKRRRTVIFGQTRRQLGPIFHALARQKECQIVEGHLLPDHVHMCIAKMLLNELQKLNREIAELKAKLAGVTRSKADLLHWKLTLNDVRAAAPLLILNNS